MNMRKELLIKLLEVDSVSYEEERVMPIIIEELNTLGFSIYVDSSKNIFATRGDKPSNGYPLLNAHMDIVDIGFEFSWMNYGYGTGSKYGYDKEMDELIDLDNFYDQLGSDEIKRHFKCEDCSMHGCEARDDGQTTPCDLFDIKFTSYNKLKKVMEEYKMDEQSDDELINAYYQDMKGDTEEFYVYENKNYEIHGSGGRVLGGDDKCGIFIALEVARLLKDTPMKILFTSQEEVGCIGVKYAIKNNRDWFDDIAYSITIDRKGGNELLWSQLGTRSCSNEFASKLAMVGIKNGIPVRIEDGSVADVIHIREIVPNAVNISAGYYNPHDEDEYVKIIDVIKIIHWVKNFLIEGDK